MPLVLALALLLGLSTQGGWGCLQCDTSVRLALRQLRLAIIPSRFRWGQQGARAQALLLGMEGSFFRNYAVKAFVGQVDEPLLEELVSLREKVTAKLKRALHAYEFKACNHKICLDRQPRVALRYDGESTNPQNQALLGTIVSLFLAVFAFGVIVASAITYRENRKLLLQ
ncbi:izumo sperm-egg fusion protein 2 [Glossophaga mutica]